MVGLDPQMLEHAGAAIELQVVAVLEAAAREEVGEIFRGVAAGVDDFELRNLARIPTLVRQIVMANTDGERCTVPPFS